MAYFTIGFWLFSFSAFANIVSIEGRNLLTQAPIKIQMNEAKKASVLIFMSAKCPCSHSHVKKILELQKDYPEYSFIAIHSNADESEEITKKYFSEIQLPFTLVQDERSQLADQLKAYKTPHAFVLSPEGVILYQGGITNSATAESSDRFYLKEALEDIKQGQKVKTPEGRTLGCYISRG